MGPLAIIGAVVSAAGTMFSAISQGQAASYQAQVANNNAKAAEQNAEYTAHAGDLKAVQTSEKSAGRVGAVKAAMAANGIDTNQGSAVDVNTSARTEGQQDTQMVQNNAALQVYGYRVQSMNFKSQAQLDSAEAEDAPIAGLLGGMGSLLGGASSWGGAPNAAVASGAATPDQFQLSTGLT